MNSVLHRAEVPEDILTSRFSQRVCSPLKQKHIIIHNSALHPHEARICSETFPMLLTLFIYLFIGNYYINVNYGNINTFMGGNYGN